MSIDLTIRPTIPEHDLKVLSRLRAEFDHKIENQEPLAHKEIIALGTNLSKALINSIDGGMDKLLALREQAIAEQTYLRLIVESDQPVIRALPWELTFHADKRLEFLSHNPAFSLLRRLRQPDEKIPDLPALPLKILLFIASPENLDPERARLDFEKEENFLFQQLDDALSNGLVEVEVAEDGSLETLQRKLENAVYHVVHLSMHGHMQEDGAALAFEDRDAGQLRYVAPDQLIAALSKAKHPVPCVLLAACQTALPDTQRAVPDYACALLEAGVPHVIGMRRSVGDEAATNFAGYFYRALAAGKEVDRAVAEARQALPVADDYMQWSIPVLYSRKQSLTCVDAQKPFQPSPRMQASKIQIGELLFEKEGFIGRRMAIRHYYRGWAGEKNQHLLLYGIGGVGKTALAGHFALRLLRENSAVRIFAFVAPFDFATMEEQLRAIFLEYATEKEIAKRQILENPLERLLLMIITITTKVPCVFIFDNIESCLDLQSQCFLPTYQSIEVLIATLVSNQARAWSILTSRYPIHSDKLNQFTFAELLDASLGDILRFMRKWQWPIDTSAEEKLEIFQTLGGNFRSIEWLAGLLTTPALTWKKLQKKFSDLQPLAQTKDSALQVVIEAMRRDLIFDELLKQLTPQEKLFLRRLCLELQPLIKDGLRSLWDEGEDLETAITRLADYRLLESAISPDHGMLTYRVPPLVSELLSREPLSEEIQRDTHARLGRFWRFAGSELTRFFTDALAAFEHFSMANLQNDADSLLEDLSDEFNYRQEYGNVIALLEPYVKRCGQNAPWWALNRLGLSLYVLGKTDNALHYHFQAEKLMQSARLTQEKRNLGVSFNNISNIYDTRGDYATALDYLFKSLAIMKEIGDRSGEGTTLNNIGRIYIKHCDYTKALEYLQKSLEFSKELGDLASEARTLTNISQIYDIRSDFVTALDYLQKSLTIIRKTDDRESEAMILNNIGQNYIQRDDYTTALEYLQKALVIHENIGNLEGLATTLTNIGHIFLARSDHKMALMYLKKSLSIAKEIGDRQIEGIALNIISQVYEKLGDYTIALEYLEKCLGIRKEIGDLIGQFTAFNNIAVIYQARGDYTAALDYLQKCLKIQRETGSKMHEAVTLNNIGQIYKETGDFRKALDYLQKSLAITTEIGDRIGEATTLGNIGLVYDTHGEYEIALNYAQKSLAISEEIGDNVGESKAINNIAGIYHAIGNFDKALEYYQKSLVIQREIGHREGEITSLNNIGQIYKIRGDYDTALEYYKSCLGITKEVGHRAGECMVLINIGMLFYSLGDLSQALECSQNSLAITKEIGDRHSEGTVLNNIGQIYAAQGNYTDAEGYWRKSLALLREIGDPRSEATILNNIGQIYLTRGDYESALEYWQKSLEIAKGIGNRAGEGLTLGNISQIYTATRDYQTALEYLQQSLVITREIGDRVGEGRALHNIANIHLEKGEFEEAIEKFTEALQIADETNNAEGLYFASRSLGELLCYLGQKEYGLPLLHQALEVGEQIGHPSLSEVEELLQKYR